jgi:Myb-like DNA-binding domain
MPFTIGKPSPNRMKQWSSEDETKLLDMRAAGYPWSVVAKALGRTQASCESRYAMLRKRQEDSIKS